MKLVDAEMLKDLSTEEIEQLGREIKSLHRRVREELGSRERHCAYCGDRLDAPVYDFKYCSAWHRYLDDHKNTETVSRAEFERKRAVNRIRTIKRAAKARATLYENSNPEEAAELRSSLRNLRIRRVLKEYQTITGESLNKSIRNNDRFKTTDQ